MRYEMIREIFNSCSNNQMRDIYVFDVETEDPELILADYIGSKDEIKDKTILPDGTVIFEVIRSGLRQRYSFTPDD